MKETDTFAYMMAAEKVSNIAFTLEQTIEFMNEYSIKPDEEVKKVLTPIIEKWNKWLKST